MSEETPKAFVCVYEQATTDLVIPLSVLRAAEGELDLQRERRRRVAEADRAAAGREAARPKGWRGWVGAFFGRTGS